MKRLISILLCFAVFALCFAGCAQQEAAEPLFPYKANLDLSTEIIMEDGVFLYAGAFVNYLDFETAQALPYCIRPNCQHNTENCGAWAFGPVDSGGVLTGGDKKFILGDKLYSLEPAKQADNSDLGEPGPEAALKVSRLDGSGERTVGSIKGDALEHLTFTLYDNAAYAITYVKRNETGGNQNPMETYQVCYLTEIDLNKGKVVSETKLLEGYLALASIFWIYNGCAYLRMSVLDEPIDEVWLLELNETYDTASREYHDKLMEAYRVNGWFRMDLSTGEMTPWEDGYPAEYDGPHTAVDHAWDVQPIEVWRDWCLYSENDHLKARNMQTGEEQTIGEEPIGWLNRFTGSIGEDALYYRQNAEDPAWYRYDFDTGEALKIPTAGLDTELKSVLRKTDRYLFAMAAADDSPIGETFCRLDLSKGWNSAEWEKIKIDSYIAGTIKDPETKETRITIKPWDTVG